MANDTPADDARAAEVLGRHLPALQRLAAATEADPEKRRDLVQEMQLAIWRALPTFEGRASERTFVLRIAHNVAATAVVRGKRDRLKSAVPVESLELEDAHPSAALDARERLGRVFALVERLVPLDRQVLLLYLEGLSAAEIADVTGLSPANVATKVSRLKAAISRRIREEEAR